MTHELFTRHDVGSVRAEGWETMYENAGALLDRCINQDVFIANLVQQYSADQGGAPNELAQVAMSLCGNRAQMIEAVNVLDTCWALCSMFAGPGPDEARAWAMFTSWWSGRGNKTVGGPFDMGTLA